MNERIKELADEADLYAESKVHYYMGQFDGVTWESKIKQVRDTRFAHLIVAECIDYCGENLSKTVGGALKIHFGGEK